MAAAVATAYEIALGGAAGAAAGWGRCLAVRVGEDLAGLRSQLGNALAEESQRRGLRPVAAVAYIEARCVRGGAALQSRALPLLGCCRCLQHPSPPLPPAHRLPLPLLS